MIQHPDQDAEAQQKLAALEKKFGKKPNILIFLLEDMGWMDPGFNGGGMAVGNSTPVYDVLPKVREMMEKNADKGSDDLLLNKASPESICPGSNGISHLATQRDPQVGWPGPEFASRK